MRYRASEKLEIIRLVEQLSLLLIPSGAEIRAFPGDADSVGRLHMILLHSILSEFRSRTTRQLEVIAPRRRNQRSQSLGRPKYRGFCRRWNKWEGQLGDLTDKGIATDEHKVRHEMTRLLEEARTQVSTE